MIVMFRLSVLTSLLVGAFSGLLSFSVIFLGDFFYSQGLIFGAVLGVYYYFKYKVSIVRLLLFIGTSMVAYNLAVRMTLYSPYLFENFGGLFAIMLGGIVGGAVMVSGFALCIRPLPVSKIIVLTTLSGLLGFSWYILPAGTLFKQESDDLTMEPFLSLYVIWQAGMSAALRLAISENLPKK